MRKTIYMSETECNGNKIKAINNYYINVIRKKDEKEKTLDIQYKAIEEQFLLIDALLLKIKSNKLLS